MTTYITLQDIRVLERIRKHFDPKELANLAADIEKHGLYHAVVLDPNGSLVAGGRRLQAIALIYASGGTFTYAGLPVPKGQVPYIAIEEEDEEALLEIELHENLIRADLTWQERVAAEAKLHALRLASNPSHTITATAKEIDGEGTNQHSITRVSNAVKIARHLHDPEVRAAQTERVALRIAERKAANVNYQDKIASLSSLASPHLIEQKNFFEIGPQLMSGYFDIIITDPPYGIGADSFNNENTLKHSYTDDHVYGRSCYTLLANEGYRITKPNATLYTFLSVELFTEIAQIFLLAGWIVHPRPLIWAKGSQGYWPDQNYGPRYTYEAILMARKGDKKVLECANDVISIPLKAGVRRQAAKPPALYHNLLKRTALAGDKVLDPFMGSGPVIPAANVLNLEVVGFDIDPEAVALSLESLTSTNLE